MFVFYFFILFLLLSLSNIYVIWLLMEFMFLYFLLIILVKEIKSVGLIIYFSFQSVMSLFLFSLIFLGLSKMMFFVLIAKLGLFPFFYWMIVVSVKVSYLGNMFILGVQKFSVMWMVWLLMDVEFVLVIFLVYLSIFFVIINLLTINDVWLLLVYSSIVNSALILFSVYGSQYIFILFLYVFMIMGIINFLKNSDSYMEVMYVLFFFMVVPPFVLFFMKFYVMFSLDFFLKLAFYLSIFDVFVLLYYFSLVFMKFILMDLQIMIYMMNFLILVLILLFSNCVTLIVFYKS